MLLALPAGTISFQHDVLSSFSSFRLTVQELVRAAADDEHDGQHLAEGEHVLHQGGEADAQAVDQSDHD